MAVTIHGHGDINPTGYRYNVVFMRKIIILLVINALLFVSCSSKMRDLEQMHLNGNVVKIETVSLTNIPIMEMYAKNNPQYYIATTDGNYILTFNGRGNIKRYQGFGMANDELFDVSPKRGKKISASAPVGDAPIEDAFDSIDFDLNENGDVVGMDYYKNDSLARRTFITYNSLYRPIMLVGNSLYCGKLGNEDFFLRHDTTLIKYLKNDKYGNWTELEVERRCNILPKRNHGIFHVLRQITYRGEKKKEPLINQHTVKHYFAKEEQLTTHQLYPIQLGEIATISIPDYMVSADMGALTNFIKIANWDTSIYNYDLCRYVYKDESSYATFSVEYRVGKSLGLDEMTADEREYDEEIDEKFRAQYETPEIQKMVVLLKWYPYSFVKINNHWALLQRYIRYGKGSWIPIYVEQYMIDTPNGGVLSIIMSYQINHRKYFHQDFINSIWSLRF